MWLVPNNWVLHQIYIPCKVFAFDNGICWFYEHLCETLKYKSYLGLN